MTPVERTAGARDTRVGRIPVPTDFSRGATKALRWSVAVKAAFDAELVVLYVVDLDALAYLDLGGDPALGGTSRRVSLELLERIRAEAGQALSRLTGSVADHVIRHSTVPVLTVRDPEAA